MRATTKTVLIDFTQIPSYTQVTTVITAIIENVAGNQDGVRYTNTATLGWYNLVGDAIAPVTSNPVTTDLVEPQLVIDKTAYPTNMCGQGGYRLLHVTYTPRANLNGAGLQRAD